MLRTKNRIDKDFSRIMMNERFAELRILEADPEDAELLDRLEILEKEAFGESGLTRWILPFFLRYGKVLALYSGEEIAGLCHFMRDWNKPESVLMTGFSVKEEFRGRGAGSFFLEAALGVVTAEAHEVYLTVAPDNKTAIALYKKYGFQETGQVKDFFGGGEDRLVLKLTVNC